MRDRKAAKTSNIWMDSPDRYGLVSRALHWGMAYLLIWQFFSILIWKVFGQVEWVKTVTSFGPHHGTVGLLIIPLVVTRAGWVLVNRKCRPPYEANWLGRIAFVGHATLYALMFAIPALALLRAYGNGKGWSPWGLPLIPATGEEVAWLVASADTLHSPLAWLLLILIIGHILMALLHQFTCKDGVLARMAGRFWHGAAIHPVASTDLKEMRDLQ